MVLDDNANPRVQAHAGAALVNFSEDCPKNILTPYLDAIMAKLESILTAKFQELVEKGTKLVLEQVCVSKTIFYLHFQFSFQNFTFIFLCFSISEDNFVVRCAFWKLIPPAVYCARIHQLKFHLEK